MRVRSHGALLVAVLVVLVAAGGLVGAHGWVVIADSQVVGDDTVVISHVSMLEGGYLAVHEVEDDEPGRVLGHVHFPETGEHDNVEVSLDDDWNDIDGAVEVVAVVHTDDGDGEFEWPGDDGIFRPDDPVDQRFEVQPADDGSARVVGRRGQTDGSVTLSLVDLPEDGFVVLYDDEDGERGDVVGVEPLSAGHHEDVTVSIAPQYYNDQGASIFFVAGVHRDDGDGAFDPESDPAITVGDSAVTSRFDVIKTRSTISTSSPTLTTSLTPSPSPTATPTAGSGSPSPTQSPTATADTTSTGTESPGFGPLAALVALGLLALHRLRVRR